MRFAALLVLAAAASCAAPPAPRPSSFMVRLWPGPAPIGDGSTEACAIDLLVYLPASAVNTRAAVVVCPGGGYIRHVLDREGFPIAEWLTSKGIAAVILTYRLPEGRPSVPLLDAQRALRTVRANAAAWDVDPARVGILGFSAGGHVASTAGTHFDDGRPGDADPVERQGSRPDFVMLVYPVVTMGEKAHELSKQKLLGKNPSADLVKRYSNEEQVTPRTPPAFLAHAKDDSGVVPDNSRDFVRAMKEHGVPVEYLELPSGNHGLNGCKGPLWEQWKAESLAWLAARGFLSSK